MESKSPKPHFHVAAGLIRKDGKILISKRPRGSHLEGYWEFPGGKQEREETLERCLEREIQEELGVRIRAGDLLFTTEYEYENKSISLHLFRCLQLQGQPRSLEGQETRWVSPRDLDNYTFPPPDQEIIQFLKAH
jgi:mutator protein MutT